MIHLLVVFDNALSERPSGALVGSDGIEKRAARAVVVEIERVNVRDKVRRRGRGRNR